MAAVVDNDVRGSVTGVVVQAGSIQRVSVTGAARAADALDERLRLLAAASRQQWTTAANDRRLLRPAPLPIRWCRSAAAVVGPESAAGYPRFDPLPGLTVVGHGLGAGGRRALHGVYGGLPSGRLLLIGPPGSGKSAAALLLLLDALRFRELAAPEERAQIPVPVLFTLAGWHPDRGDSVTEWMAGKLAETYPMFRGRTGRGLAIDLLSAGRVAGFLDGLDEIPESVRPGVLDALADAPFRLVLLSRTAEAVGAAHHGPLAGAVAVELQPVRPIDAAAYLRQPLLDPPPPGWQAVSAHLVGQPGSVLSKALTTPLALSLLRDVYGPAGPVGELLDNSRFRTTADIENHLLDQAIPAAYTPRPGHPPPRYTVATAQRTLRYLATELTEQHTTDLAWWHIPTWTARRVRMAGVAANTILGHELIYGLPIGLVFGPALGLLTGLVLGLMTIFGAAGTLAPAVPIMPQRISRISYRSTVRNLRYGLFSGIVSGLLAGLPAGLVFGLSAGLAVGGSVGLISALAAAALRGLARHTEVAASSLGPADVWRHDLHAGLVLTAVQGGLVGLLAALTASLAPGLAGRVASNLPVVLVVGLTVGLVFVLGIRMIASRADAVVTAPGAAVSDTTVALARLRVRHQLPLHLIDFLEDARSRHLLRTVGPVYQFRHATLQDRLARSAPERSSM